MIDTILVAGNGGAGKSIMVWYLSSLLTESGFEIHYLSDRLGLEEGVMNDTKHVKPRADGSKVGRHSKLIADGPPGHKKVHVLDGSILNKVHEDMISEVRKKNDGRIFLIEYATGPEIQFGLRKEPLRQTTDHLVSFIKRYNVLDRLFFIDVQVPVNIRAIRQSHRPDAMATETFEAYFGDGGYISSRACKYLGKHYYRFGNIEEDNDGYFSEVRHLYETRILPRLISLKGGMHERT